jgi:hypothetical protein
MLFFLQIKNYSNVNHVAFSGHEDSMLSEDESTGETSKPGDGETPTEATSSSTAAQTECRCGAPSCRKIIF